LEKFIREKKFYDKVGKPWQLGILLKGEPGCGKTSFITALANKLNRSIKDLQFNRMKTIDDLEGAFNCITYNNKNMDVDKVIMVAEDFDCMTDIAKSRKLQQKEQEDAIKMQKQKKEQFSKQMETMKSDEAKAIMCAIANQDDDMGITLSAPKNDNSTREITLSNLLNILDGINTLTGRIIIFTSNYPDTLDEAFLRSGRIDLKIELGRHSKSVLYEQMQYWYKCLDEFYPNNNYEKQFEDAWKRYEHVLENGKHLPCDVANILQKYAENIEKVFAHLI
jgi:chaperone BCS1